MAVYVEPLDALAAGLAELGTLDSLRSYDNQAFRLAEPFRRLGRRELFVQLIGAPS